MSIDGMMKDMNNLTFRLFSNLQEDPNLYFSTEGPVTSCTHQPICSALAEIIFPGTKWNSQATTVTPTVA